ncbi:hypothetical protein OG978_46575 (plasmid) [Streptomyces sp. NBC_01591]|nr:hypothetical protein [Streptomyces sp. NBC_01591]WSD73589.1 hypothetical protein OG978_00855 [Streptomyces sp. NBC_01591]WSD73610.1 hypothetical protein OG978_39975 [Streptomyces sp. NBC_01591]WSD74677.1 hypothetical protein OG978_41670 [Streptomyces sp. NBC_01591]WSD74689.1 hypothetical protein OG978_46575 [Streptomyces sp. NBC_01591]
MTNGMKLLVVMNFMNRVLDGLFIAPAQPAQPAAQKARREARQEPNASGT